MKINRIENKSVAFVNGTKELNTNSVTFIKYSYRDQPSLRMEVSRSSSSLLSHFQFHHLV